MKNIVLIAVLILSGIVKGQDTVKNYAYVVVPNQYEFLKEPNQYRLNELTEFLFEKFGFDAYMEGSVPEKLLSDPCNGLRANVTKESGLLTTKVVVTLTNCRGAVVVTTKEGKSREKVYEKAFNFALRDAFEDIEALHYKYEGKAKVSKSQEPEATKSKVVKEDVAVTDKKVIKQEVSVAPVNVWRQKLHVKQVDGLNYEVLDAQGNVIGKLLYTTASGVYLVAGADAMVYKMENNPNWIYFETTSSGMQSIGLDIDLK